MKTVLKNRTLWYDGTNQVEPDDVPSLILSGTPLDKIVVNHLNEDLELFNTLEDIQFPLNKVSNLHFDMSWNIPQYYADLDIADYAQSRLKLMCDEKQLDYELYNMRLQSELREISSRKIIDLFRALIYVTETLLTSGTALGVGRGSSCASLFLFIIKLHKVDPVKFNIHYSEFFHD